MFNREETISNALSADIIMSIKTSGRKTSGVSLHIKAKDNAVDFLNNFTNGFISDLEDIHSYCLLGDYFDKDSSFIVKEYANEMFEFEFNISTPQRDAFYIFSTDQENIDTFVDQLKMISNLTIHITDKRSINPARSEENESERQRIETINREPVPQQYNCTDQLFFTSPVINIEIKWKALGILMLVNAANANLMNIFTQAYIFNLENEHDYFSQNHYTKETGPHRVNVSLYVNVKNNNRHLFELTIPQKQPGKNIIFTTDERNIDRYLLNLRKLSNLILNISDERLIKPAPSQIFKS